MKIPSIFFCGHESPFGRATLNHLLSDEHIFGIEIVVFADYHRWNIFRQNLLKEEYKILNHRAFKRHLQGIIRELTKYGIRSVVIHDINSQDAHKLLYGMQIGLCAAFPQIFSNNLIKFFSKGIMNFHPSYLPRLRGANPIYWAIFKNEKYTGITAHIMSSKIDDGKIIARIKVEIDTSIETYKSLYQKVIDKIPELFKSIEKYYYSDKHDLKDDSEYSSYYYSDRNVHHKTNLIADDLNTISAKIRAGGAFTFCSSGDIILLRGINIIAKENFNDRGLIQEIQYYPDGIIIRITNNLIYIFKSGHIVEIDFEYFIVTSLWRKIMKIIVKRLSIPIAFNIKLKPYVGEIIN